MSMLKALLELEKHLLELRQAVDWMADDQGVEHCRRPKIHSDNVPVRIEGAINAIKAMTATLQQIRQTRSPKAALSTQVGGGHYKSMAIQPVEYNQKNGLKYCEACVVKYVSRHREKNGVEDLKKAKHFLDLLIEMEYGQPE